MKNKRTQIWISTAIAVLITIAAVYVLRSMLTNISVKDLEIALRKIHTINLIAALILTTACFVMLSVYDWAALKAIGHKQEWTTALLGAVASYSLSHNLGFAPITSTGARWRIYGPRGIPFKDIARIVFMTGLSFWIGVIFQFSLVMMISPKMLGAHLPGHIPVTWQTTTSLIIAFIFLLYVACNSMGIKHIGWKEISVPTPSTRSALAQTFITIMEIGLASAVLWILIPGADLGDYGYVYIAYLVAFTTVLISHAPGGIGVLEAVSIGMLPQLGAANVLVGLLLFRIAFHIVPLIAGAAIMLRTPTIHTIPEQLAKSQEEMEIKSC